MTEEEMAAEYGRIIDHLREEKTAYKTEIDQLRADLAAAQNEIQTWKINVEIRDRELAAANEAKRELVDGLDTLVKIIVNTYQGGVDIYNVDRPWMSAAKSLIAKHTEPKEEPS